MKFSGKAGNGPMNKGLNFGGGSDPYRDTVKACLGGGMQCPSELPIRGKGLTVGDLLSVVREDATVVSSRRDIMN